MFIIQLRNGNFALMQPHLLGKDMGKDESMPENVKEEGAY